MTCGICLSANATLHVTDCHSSGQFVDIHCCEPCWEATVGGRPRAAPRLPRPNFTLKSVLIVVASFAIANFLTVGMIRITPLIRQTPEALNSLTLAALLMVNSSVGEIVGFVFLSNWLRALAWYKKTGGTRLGPSPDEAALSRNLASLSVSWIWPANMLAASLSAWLRHHDYRSAAICATLSALSGFGFALLARKDDGVRSAYLMLRANWHRATQAERILTVVLLLWPLAISLAFFGFFASRSARLILRSVNPWMILPIFIPLVLGTLLAIQFAGVFVAGRLIRKSAHD